MAAPYPLICRPILMEKVWGGRRLERFGKALPPGAFIGESWEVADLAATSVSGGGGGEARSVIANGPLAGGTLHEAIGLWGEALIGSARPTPDGGFPLLVKYLDARENLSVQVHPSPSYAAAHPECHLKTECWYILEAEPGAVIYKGVKPGVTPESFARSIRAGTAVECLEAAPAVAGECHALPSGTCHALGAGVLVAEVQTPSDTTFRVYDWGRAGRELHIEQALACIEFGPAPAATRVPDGQRCARLVSTEFFMLDIAHAAAADPLTVGYGNGPFVVMCLSGGGRLRSVEGRFEDVRLGAGETALVPAAVACGTVFVADAHAEILRAAVAPGR